MKRGRNDGKLFDSLFDILVSGPNFFVPRSKSIRNVVWSQAAGVAVTTISNDPLSFTKNVDVSHRTTLKGSVDPNNISAIDADPDFATQSSTAKFVRKHGFVEWRRLVHTHI